MFSHISGSESNRAKLAEAKLQGAGSDTCTED